MRRYESDPLGRQVIDNQIQEIIQNPDRTNESRLCKAIKSNGERCKNRTRRSAYCQPQLMQLKGLRIGNSKLPDAGLGLFSARKQIPKNTIITPYTGTRSNHPISGNYVLQVNKNKWLNANCTIDIGGHANDCRWKNRHPKQCYSNNAKFMYNKTNKGHRSGLY